MPLTRYTATGTRSRRNAFRNGSCKVWPLDMYLPSKRSAMLSLWAPSGSHDASPAIHRWPEVAMMAQRRARRDCVSAGNGLVQEGRKRSVDGDTIDFGIEPSGVALATQP